MKPIHLNLAARPYRDFRPLYAVVVLTSLVIAFLMLNNIETYYRYVSETKTTREEIDRIDARADQERKVAAAVNGELKRVDLASLDRQTKFINAQLAERAFSWSELLDRLETALPPDVRIISVAPSFSPNGLVHLNMQCEAKTSDGMLVTIARLQHNPAFGSPFPTSENNTGQGYVFGLDVDYRPSVARAVSP